MKRQNSKPTIAGRIDAYVQRYRIIAGETPKGCRAQAYIGRRQIGQSSGATTTDAVETLETGLLDRLQRLADQRREGVPCVEEFREAIELGFAKPDDELQAIIDKHVELEPVALDVVARAARIDADDLVKRYRQLAQRTVISLHLDIGQSNPYDVLFQNADADVRAGKLSFRNEFREAWLAGADVLERMQDDTDGTSEAAE